MPDDRHPADRPRDPERPENRDDVAPDSPRRPEAGHPDDPAGGARHGKTRHGETHRDGAHRTEPDNPPSDPPRLDRNPRPRLRRIGRGAVAAAAVVGMLVMSVLTLRYSRDSLQATRQDRPPVPGTRPVGVDEIQRYEPPTPPGPPSPPPAAEPADPAPPPPPIPRGEPRRPSSDLRAALRSELVPSGTPSGRSTGARTSPTPDPRQPLPSFDDLVRRLEPAAGDRLQRTTPGTGLPGPATPTGPSPVTATAATPTPRNLLPAPTPGASAVHATPRPPAGRLLLRAGTFVPATLAHRVDSDQPGLLRAVVSRDVHDSLTGATVLIPRGTVLLGRQGDLPSLGQDRLAVVWDRLLYPDGRTLDLGAADAALPSAALDGSAGLPGRVRRHWGRRIGAAALLSLVGAGVQLSQPGRSGTDRTAEPGEIAAGALGLELGRVSREILRRHIDLPPTIDLAPGARLHALLTRDLVFTNP